MEKGSELISDTEKLLQTFEYVLILENKCIELNKNYNKIEKQLNSYKSDNLEKDEIIASNVDEINSLKSELDSLSDDNLEKDVIIASNVDEINLLKNELDDSKSICAELTSGLSDYEKIKNELNEYKHNNLEKDVIIASKADEINLLRSELNSYKNRCQKLNDIINNLNNNISNLENEIDCLKNQSVNIKPKNTLK